jgi:hypothetical protein
MSVTRFLVDAKGTYDLACVSAITKIAQKDINAMPFAALITDGGVGLQTETPYAIAVEAWTAFLEQPDDEEEPEPEHLKVVA